MIIHPFLTETERIISKLQRIVSKKITTLQLNGSEFIPFMQPICKSDTVIGCEVLLRVKKDGVYYGPEPYLPGLESSDAINDVTCALLYKVINHFQAHPVALPEGFYFSFNICVKQLNSTKVIDAIRSFNKYFMGASVVLEIVERGTTDFDDFALDAMQLLVEEGVRFSIDDFGSGSSGLKYIELTGFTTIKIDKCLTVMNKGSLVYSMVIDAIMAISYKLNMQVIAEGVESKEQLSLLKEKGIHCFQGYFFSRPIHINCFCGKYLNGDRYN